jgi:hypothetical protein
MSEAILIETALTPAQLDRRAELDAIVRNGIENFRAVAIALNEIKEQALWRSTHQSFGDYCEAMLGRGYSQSYRLAKAGDVLNDLAGCATQPTSNRQTEPLERLAPQERREAWEAASEIAQSGARSLNRETVREAVRAVQEPPAALNPGERVTVQSGPFAGAEVEIVEVKGVVVTARQEFEDSDDGRQIALLSTEVTTPPTTTFTKAAQKPHPLAAAVEIADTRQSILATRIELLEALLSETIPVLPIGDLRSRIQAVL